MIFKDEVGTSLVRGPSTAWCWRVLPPFLFRLFVIARLVCSSPAPLVHLWGALVQQVYLLVSPPGYLVVSCDGQDVRLFFSVQRLLALARSFTTFDCMSQKSVN